MLVQDRPVTPKGNKVSLYPNTKFLCREHYDIIVELAKGKNTALEFGPGATTLALIEAEVKTIHSCEYNEDWLNHYQEVFSKYPQVSIHKFANEPTIRVTPVIYNRYDIAIVDSPVGDGTREKLRGQENLSRFNTLVAACKRSPIVILHDANREGETASLEALKILGHSVEVISTERGLAIIRR